MATAESTGMNNIKDKMNLTASKIRETGEKAVSEVSNQANVLREKGDKGLSSLGGKMSDVAETIREQAPSGGSFSSAANAVADKLETGGEYLTEHGINDIAGDVGNVVKRYPLQSLVVGIGLGVLLGNAMTRR